MGAILPFSILKIIRAKMGREAVYSIAKPCRLPQISLNSDGLYQLALCHNLLLHLLPKAMLDHAEKTLQQASAYTDGLGASPEEAVQLSQVYTKGRIDYTPFQEMLETFITAMHSRQVCLVTHQSQLTAEPRTFEFAPKRLIAYHETMQILGWEVTEKGRPEAKYENPMPLHLHRCKEVALTRRTAGHLPAPNSAQKENEAGPFGVMKDEAFTARVKFAKEAATYVYERQWSSKDKKELHKDGSLTLTFEAQSEPEVISWVLSFGERATLLSPEKLKEKIQLQCINMTEKYSQA